MPAVRTREEEDRIRRYIAREESPSDVPLVIGRKEPKILQGSITLRLDKHPVRGGVVDLRSFGEATTKREASKYWLYFSGSSPALTCVMSSQGLPIQYDEGIVILSDLYVHSRDQQKIQLQSVIDRLTTVPFGNPDTGTIAQVVTDAARTFLSLLPDDTPMPKVAPDHEGGLLLVWESTDPEIIVTLEGNRLHFVVHPGTPNAEYFDDLEFTGDKLPAALVDNLPKINA
jgi:hypothetical protein